jgi:hypothetical protein
LGLMWAKTDNQTDIFWNQVQSWLNMKAIEPIADIRSESYPRSDSAVYSSGLQIRH